MENNIFSLPEENTQPLLDRVYACQNELRDALAGDRVTAKTMAKALSYYFPELSFQARREMSLNLLAGVIDGRREKAFDSLGMYGFPVKIQDVLEDLLSTLRPEEQRRMLLAVNFELLSAADIEMTQTICENLSAESTAALKSTIVAFAREQDTVQTEKLLSTQHLRAAAENMISDARFSPEENAWITAAAICAVNRVQAAEECRQTAIQVTSWHRIWERIRDPLLTIALPIVAGVGTLIVSMIALWSMPIAVSEFLAAHIFWEELVCSGLPFVLAAGFAAAGASELGNAVLDREYKREEAEGRFTIHSEVLKDKAGELSSATRLSSIRERSDIAEMLRERCATETGVSV